MDLADLAGGLALTRRSPPVGRGGRGRRFNRPLQAAGSAAPYTKRAGGRGDLPRGPGADLPVRADWPVRAPPYSSSKN